MAGYFFFLQLGVGLLVFLHPVSLTTTGKGFGKLIGLVALGSLLFAAMLRLRADLAQGGMPSAALWGSAAALLGSAGYVGALSGRDRRKHAAALWVATALALGALILSLRGLPSFPATLGNALLSALLLGAITDAMVLGHWYIVLPKMALDPLKRLTAAFIVLLVARGLFVALAGQPAWPVGLDDHPELFWPALFTIQRLSVGIAVPFVLSLMVWKTAQMRSTQSATGILYVANVFVFVGELTSTYMTYTMGRIA